MAHIWLVLDPHPNGRAAPRVSVHMEPPESVDFPPGHGPMVGEAGWEIREHDVPDDDLVMIFSGEMPPEGQQLIHARWWDEAGDNEAEPFADLWDRQVYESRTRSEERRVGRGGRGRCVGRGYQGKSGG